MELIHNMLFRILEEERAGLYRVVLNEIQIGKLAAVRLDPPIDKGERRGGRKKLEKPKQPRKKSRAPLVGKLSWFEQSELKALVDKDLLVVIEEEPESIDVSMADIPLFERRKSVMSRVFDFDHFREQVLIHRGIAGLVCEAMVLAKASRSMVRQCFSLLFRLGFVESSLKPRRDLCGGPDVSRPCNERGRQKAGAKTHKQRIERAFSGICPPPDQPGTSSLWKKLILAADKLIPTPKPPMPRRSQLIVDSSFVARYKQENGKLVKVDPQQGCYPNSRQIRRVLEQEIPRLQRLLDKTTKGHFARSLRGLVARNWQGVAGPGHTWAIDSTVGDIYLRSSVNRAWIIGRPIVYVIVDVWSTAIVGFYVCLEGPSWATAKVSLFCSAAPHELIGELWGYQPMFSLCPSPTMCAVLLCDRGEYLSKGASITGAKLIPCMSYAAPYRPDWKGLVEVLHRIEKDRQYHFVPGAIDQRRKEYELRRFNPHEAVFTIRDFTAYLYTIFTEYNLTADRRHRVDAHMKGVGVFPSPAGLWRYGHEVGVGVRRSLPLTELITGLLPQEVGRVTRGGVMFGGREYGSDIVNEQQWTAHARNFGGWDISAHYFPGTVSRIWTPNLGGNGLLDLQLADTSTASPELTVDEALDAFSYGTIFNADVAHANTINALHSIHRQRDLIENAKRLTEEAIARYNGPSPTMTESRKMETGRAPQPVATPAEPDEAPDAAEATHAKMMKALFAATNGGVPQDD